MTSESLPRHDRARAVLRVAFTLASALVMLLAVAVIVTVTSAATAPARGPAECSGLDDDRARLACFDGLFPRRREPATALQSDAGASAPASPAAPPAASPAVQEASFGVNDTVLRARGAAVDSAAALQSITSPLTRLDPLEPGRARLTLGNGQVWEQVETSTSFQPRKGELITVRQAALGSFLMSGTRGGAVRARRVR